MLRAKWIPPVLTALLVLSAVFVAAVPASQRGRSVAAPPGAVTIAAGDDGWVTDSGTELDLAGFPIDKIFGGRQAGSTAVPLKGKPLNAAALGDIDTIVERPKDITLTPTERPGGRAGATGSGPLRIVALSLVSEQPVSIGGQSYQLHVGLSDIAERSAPGSITLTMTSGDGGTFASSLLVRPKLVFTPEKGGQALTIDCGAVACGTNGHGFVLNGNHVPWVMTGGPGKFDPARAAVGTIARGVRIQEEGSPVYTTVGSSNFFAGVAFPGELRSVKEADPSVRHVVHPPPPPPPPLRCPPDHYKLWKVADVVFQRAVTLRGQFDQGAWPAHLVSVQYIANPVRKNEERICRPDLHYVVYSLKPERPTPPRWVTFKNQFTQQARWRLTDPALLLVPAGKSFPPSPPTQPKALADHFLCYGVRPTEPTIRTVTLVDQFDQRLQKIERPARLDPALFCVPVAKNQEPIPDGQLHLALYAITPPEQPPGPITVWTKDQFGQNKLTATESRMLAVPSQKTGWGPDK